ncbi:MAG TPA: ATP-binding protein, partial [Chitinophaga sp.]
NIVLFIFLAGTIVFVFQFRQRKLKHEMEKSALHEQHQMELLTVQLDIQHQTMQYIGREIHDSVAQKITLASIYSQRLEYEDRHPEIAAQLQSISKILNDSLAELRDLSRSLTDSSLQHASLPDLLSLECERVNATGSCKAMLQADDGIVVSPAVKSLLLRIVQEFIQNSLKHSRCRTICINLHTDEERLQLSAADDGTGFDLSSANNSGTGLQNMKRRTDLIGGAILIDSEPGNGTTLRLTIPVSQLNT